ncbi:MAG: hypothetical protein IKJ73_06435 [Lachnospiraceae bacterium]|nr:hypothetical protein [Lachnospiraceae bacterium]
MSSQNSTNKKNIKKINKRRKYVKNKCVYVMISKTATLPSQVIKMWTRQPYAHTSLAMDIELNEMYSFARKKLRNPFNCGFITEDITTGVFGRDTGTTCKIMRVWVTQAQLDKINKILKKFKDNKNYYKYNYIGIFGVVINKAVEREYNYFCSQFVYYVLSKAGVKLFDKKPGLVRPEDFRVWTEPEVIYEGKLHEYREFLATHYPKKPNSDKYIEKRGINFEKFVTETEATEVVVEESTAATLDSAIEA